METNRERIVRRLLREGWYLHRHGGKHDIYKHPDTHETIRLPRHRTIAVGIVRDMIKRTGWTDWR